MSTITHWEERLPAILNTPEEIANARDAEITELREALKVAQANVEHWKAARESAMFAGEQMQAKLSAIESQPVHELVEALECLIATHWPLEEATSSDGCYTDDPNEIKARKALANAKTTQPLTKEQVEDVIDILENNACGFDDHDYKEIKRAIEIMKGVRG